MLTVVEIAHRVRGHVVGDQGVVITGLAPADRAGAGDLTYAESEAYFEMADRGGAAAILADGPWVSAGKAVIRVDNARRALAGLLSLFHPPEEAFAPGIDPLASVDPDARVDATAHIGPGCRLGAGVAIGARTVLMGGNHIGPGARIGEDSRLHPNVTIYARSEIGNRVSIHAGTVIGSDGYGYRFEGGRHLKVPQIGHVEIHDDVEIGANAAIDRGALGPTIIGEGTKIDNLVHVAHNVVLGRHCLVMGQVGFAGSTRLGDHGVVASQSGIAGHLSIGARSVIGAKSGVMRDVPEGGRVLGIPAAPDRQAKRQMIAVQQLPDLIRQVRDLTAEVERLRRGLDREGADSAAHGGGSPDAGAAMQE